MDKQPALTRERCFKADELQRFLRLSRSTSDDSVTSAVNALLVAPDSSSRPWEEDFRAGQRPIRRKANCARYTDQVLFPAWRARDKVYDYCQSVAEESKRDKIANSSSQVTPEHKVDPRFDPYGARDFIQVTAEDQMLDWIKNERGVDYIVRDRSYSLLADRCLDRGSRNDWRDEYQQWADQNK